MAYTLQILHMYGETGTIANNTADSADSRDARLRASWAHSRRSPRPTRSASNPSRLPLISSNTRLAGDA